MRSSDADDAASGDQGPQSSASLRAQRWASVAAVAAAVVVLLVPSQAAPPPSHRFLSLLETDGLLAVGLLLIPAACSLAALLLRWRPLRWLALIASLLFAFAGAGSYLMLVFAPAALLQTIATLLPRGRGT